MPEWINNKISQQLYRQHSATEHSQNPISAGLIDLLLREWINRSGSEQGRLCYLNEVTSFQWYRTETPETQPIKTALLRRMDSTCPQVDENTVVFPQCGLQGEAQQLHQVEETVIPHVYYLSTRCSFFFNIVEST